MKISRYVLFCGRAYDASGGWRDFDSSSNSLDGLIAEGMKYCPLKDPNKWWHIADLETGEIVFDSDLPQAGTENSTKCS